MYYSGKCKKIDRMWLLLFLFIWIVHGANMTCCNSLLSFLWEIVLNIILKMKKSIEIKRTQWDKVWPLLLFVTGFCHSLCHTLAWRRNFLSNKVAVFHIKSLCVDGITELLLHNCPTPSRQMSIFVAPSVFMSHIFALYKQAVWDHPHPQQWSTFPALLLCQESSKMSGFWVVGLLSQD